MDDGRPRSGDAERLRALVMALALGSALVVNLVVRRMGYSIPGRTVARCRDGHLFTTLWVEGASMRSARLGPLRRFQRCPVGHHWSTIRPVKDAELSDEDRRRLGRPAVAG